MSEQWAERERMTEQIQTISLQKGLDGPKTLCQD